MAGETWNRSAARRTGHPSSTIALASRVRPVGVSGALAWVTRTSGLKVGVVTPSIPEVLAFQIKPRGSQRPGELQLDEVAEYRPGRFFESELPALRAVIGTLAPLDLLIVDGYVDLDPTGRPGLGAHAHDAGLAEAVVGVAETPFRAATHAAPVLRGAASKPLWATAIGMNVADAATLVAWMAGAFRVPDAIREVDRLARSEE